MKLVSADRTRLIAITLLLPSVCQAYVDPNSGGVIFQFLLPLFVAASAAWVLLKKKLFATAARMFKKARRWVDE